jgi:signal-transduction protein with cAMP-binding, CBS, and nucleotidyltransferase domain
MTKSVEIESIQKHINKISHIPEPLWEILKKHLEVEHFNKGVFLQKSKTPVTHGWLILQGIVRNHTLSIDGEEITMGIFSEGDITCAYPSFLKGEQSRDDIQTLEDSVCVSFRLDAIL